MFLDMVGVITTSKLSILSTFQGGIPEPPSMSSRVNLEAIQSEEDKIRTIYEQLIMYDYTCRIKLSQIYSVVSKAGEISDHPVHQC